MKVLFLTGIFAVAGCGGGGGGSTTGASPQEGLFTGSYVDETGGSVTVETEQYRRGNQINGTVRMVKGTEIYHGLFTGIIDETGVHWTTQLAGEEGSVSAHVNDAGELDLVSQGASVTGGQGQVLRSGDATTDNLSGQYTLSWNAEGQSGSFQLTITNEGGMDTVPFMWVKLSDNNAFEVFGTVIGNTVSLKILIAAGNPVGGTNVLRAVFAPTTFGSQGQARFEEFGPGGKNSSGSWTLTKVN